MADQQPPSGSAALCLSDPSRSDYDTKKDYHKAFGCIASIQVVINKVRETAARICKGIEPVKGPNVKNVTKELSEADEDLKTLMEIPSRNEALHASVASELSSANNLMTEILKFGEDFISKSNPVLEKASAPDAKTVPATHVSPAGPTTAPLSAVKAEKRHSSSSEPTQNSESRASVSTRTNKRRATAGTPEAAVEPDRKRVETEVSPRTRVAWKSRHGGGGNS